MDGRMRDLLSALTMCRYPSGCKRVNLAESCRQQVRGIPGAFSATFGLTLLPVVIVLIRSDISISPTTEIPALQNILKGAAAAAVALTIAMAIKTGKKMPEWRRSHSPVRCHFCHERHPALAPHALPLAMVAPIALALGLAP